MRHGAKIGDLIRSKRIAKGASQREFAETVGIHHVTLCRYERNKAMPSDENLYALAKLLDLDYDYLKLIKGSAA